MMDRRNRYVLALQEQQMKPQNHTTATIECMSVGVGDNYMKVENKTVIEG